ncbi:MAG TPA: S8 family serine peptidase [Longimicrobium sp.]|nr:S8 family serine peptidase [Longimicrobium sp.]
MNEKMGPALAAQIDELREDDRVQVHVFVRGEPARDAEFTIPTPPGHEKRGPGGTEQDSAAVVAAIQKSTMEWQAGVCSYLTTCDPAGTDPRHGGYGGEHKAAIRDQNARVIETHWINNSVTAEVSPAVLSGLLEREDVLHVELVREIALEDLLDQVGTAVVGEQLPFPPAPTPKQPPPPSWSVKLVNAPHLWAKGLTGEGVVVAVIDTGVSHLHPDLANRMWDGGGQHPGRGRNFDDGNDDPMDLDGHGTACAGIVAGDGTSGTATGVAPGAGIMALKAQSEAAMVRALQFAIVHKASVISMSMSLPARWKPNHASWRRICEVILKAGILHVNSIGNNGASLNTDPVPFNIGTPGNCPPPWLHSSQDPHAGVSSVISCGATNDENELDAESGQGPAGWSDAPFSDYPYALPEKRGLIKPDICAPGPGTKTCDVRFTGQPGIRPYREFGNTSAATPHVAGCIALLIEACIRSNNPVIPQRIQEAIETKAVRLKGQGPHKANNCGAGRIDALGAYEFGVQNNWWA